VLAVVVAAGLVGWVAGSQISSPAEVASRTAPPAAAPILVPAEERVISTDIVTRGTGRYGSPQQLSLISSALKAGQVVPARLPVLGTEVKEGDILFISSGRPVFLLSGSEPAFRDLGPGLTGNDVRQLEEALVRLGFDPGPVDGVYDSQTEAGVTAWYQGAGVSPFKASAEQTAAIRALEADRTNTEVDVISASDSVGTAASGLDAAQGAYARAQEVWQNSQSAVALAVGVANANDQAAVAAVNSRQAALSALQASGASSSEIAAAESELALARATAEATRLTGDHDVAVAEADRSAAAAEVSKTLRDVRAAETTLANANSALGVRERQANLVASDLSLAKLQAGVQVPADEIIFVPSTPVRVSEVVARSDQPGGPLITVTNATVAVDGSLRLEEAALAKPGMAVDIDEPDLGIKAKGVVTRVAESPGTNGVDGFHVYFEVAVDTPPASLIGASVRLTVPVKSTGETVLAVPVSAVTMAADGTSRVQRDQSGNLEFVTVEPGLSADGFVAVKAISGSLNAGDLVVVGFGEQDAAKQ
jgi:multidrug efflux pump subunit AcrA (membrane-fusion protein)